MLCVSINTAGPKDKVSAEVHMNVILGLISCESVNFRHKCAEIVFRRWEQEQAGTEIIPLCYFS